VVGEVEIGTASDKLVKDKIPENVAEDHARLLGMVGQCLVLQPQIAILAVAGGGTPAGHDLWPYAHK